MHVSLKQDSQNFVTFKPFAYLIIIIIIIIIIIMFVIVSKAANKFVRYEITTLKF